MKHNTRLPILFTLFALQLLLFSTHLHTVYAQAAKAKVSGFAITPSKIEAYVPQGYTASASIKIIGIRPSGAYIRWLGGSRDGVNVTIATIRQVKSTTFIKINIFAYRPGFYKYGLFIEFPPQAVKTGSVKAVPVVIVPIYIIVPGVRVSLLNLEVNMTTRIVTVCTGLVPYFGANKTNASSGYDTVIIAILDGRVVEREDVHIRRGIRKCYYLGPFKPHTVHTFTLSAEADNVSRDGVRVKFVVGKIIVNMTVAAILHNPYITFLGGIVDAGYSLYLKSNSSRCMVYISARLGATTKSVSYNIRGRLGILWTRRFEDRIARYVPPRFLIPLASLPLDLRATAYCLGVKHPIMAEAHAMLIVIDLTPLMIYAAIAAAVYIGLRIRRKRRKRRERGRGGEEPSGGE